MTDDFYERDSSPDNRGPSSAPEAPAPAGFEVRPATYIVLIFLVILWPGMSFLMLLPGTYEIDFEALDPVLFIYLPTIIIQWFIFFIVALAAWREQGGFRSLGFDPPKIKYFVYGIGFFLGSNIVLSGLQFILEMLGLTVSPDIEKLVARAGEDVWWWLAVSITAGICEETAFRGYILTRVKAITGRGWIIPVILSTMAFAAGHTYQGWGGFILIAVYGSMFCWLYIETKSLWPAIMAHFIQDFSAIFIYQIFGQS